MNRRIEHRTGFAAEEMVVININNNNHVFCSPGSESSTLEIHISSELQDAEESGAGVMEETLRR